MSRFKRKRFDRQELDSKTHDEARNRLLFDWWCDDGDHEGEGSRRRGSDRLNYIASLHGEPTEFPSRAALQNDPAPLLTEPAPQGFRKVFLLSNPEHVRQALTETAMFGNPPYESAAFGNLPYAALGGASFLLGLDPGPGYNGVDWHAQQRKLIDHALGLYCAGGLRELARKAVAEAALTCLARPEFDLALFAEQAALRYVGRLFGYGFQDHALLEEASRATYRALQYLAVGQHFVTEPGTLPAAQQALGRLVARTSELMDEYTRLQRTPHRHGFEPGRDWPEGVQPWSEVGLREPLGEPLLKRLPDLEAPGPPPSKPDERLSGRDRATIAATLVAGTLGNIQSAVCLLTQSLLRGPADERKAASAREDANANVDAALLCQLAASLEQRMAKLPPVPVLPRRTRCDVVVGGVKIKAGTDCLLLLEGQPGCVHAHTAAACPRVWGGVIGSTKAPHACLGQALSMPLIAALVRHTLCLKGLKPALDPLTGEVQKIQRLWGFGCTHYPLRFDRERVRTQHNLIVAMRVKSPISENAMRLRRLIAAGVPRIEHALMQYGHVHFAWFEFSDDDSQLVLRTIYDGQFDAYVKHFATRVGDLFDGLFEYIEGAPPLPVSEHPNEFAETLRRNNRAPLAGYLYSANPRAEAEQIRKLMGPR